MWATRGGRAGIRIRGHRGHPVVRGALVRFAQWLRSEYEFPVRVPVYLSPHARLVTLHGETVTASFFAPWEPDQEPYIRIATGDYPADRAARGRDNALAGFLSSLAHEVFHYQQWLESGEICERGVAVRAQGMVNRYSTFVDHP